MEELLLSPEKKKNENSIKKCNSLEKKNSVSFFFKFYIILLIIVIWTCYTLLVRYTRMIENKKEVNLKKKKKLIKNI